MNITNIIKIKNIKIKHNLKIHIIFSFLTTSWDASKLIVYLSFPTVYVMFPITAFVAIGAEILSFIIISVWMFSLSLLFSKTLSSFSSFKSNDLVLIVVVGAGLTWGGVLLKKI